MGLVILSLLLLTLLQLRTTPCNAAEKARFDRFKAGSTSEFKHFQSRAGFKGKNADKDGKESFGEEKRKVYTGPNPLHNR